jgi:hypothetical protein
MSRRIRRPTTVLLASALTSASSFASLTIDLRATATTGGTVIDAKHVQFSGVAGATVTMNVYSLVTNGNGNPNDDGTLAVIGSFLSSFSDMSGNLEAVRDAEFTGTGSSNGLITDLDGDGDFDVGSNNNAVAANFFAARARQFTPFTAETLIGSVTWTFTANLSETFLNYRPRVSSNAGSWIEDGTQITSSDVSVGAPVHIFVPEPAFALPLLLGALARRGHNR